MTTIFILCAFALLATWGIEGSVTILLTHSKKYLTFNIWCNAITNPLLNIICFLALWYIGSWTWFWVIILGEIAILFGEMWLYGLFDRHKNTKMFYFRLSLITNAVSFLTGLAYQLLMIKYGY